MNDLIDRGLALSLIESSRMPIKWQFGKCILKEYFRRCKEQIRSIILHMPKSDAEYIRHGYWIDAGRTEKGSIILRCSVCKKERKGSGRSNYCRDCGAKMDIGGKQLEDGSFLI